MMQDTVNECSARADHYKVGCIWNNKIYEMIVEANSFDLKNREVVFYVYPAKMVAFFTDVVYLTNLGKNLHDDHMKPSQPKKEKEEPVQEKTFGEMMNELSHTFKDGEVPPNWNAINGIPFQQQ